MSTDVVCRVQNSAFVGMNLNFYFYNRPLFLNMSSFIQGEGCPSMCFSCEVFHGFKIVCFFAVIDF